MSDKRHLVTELQDLAMSAGDVPPFPAIAMEAVECTNSPRSSAAELQEIIARDQALTSKILKIVNSAMYCFQREVSTLTHAVAILGMDTIRSIIVAASIHQMFRHGTARRTDLQTQLLWAHSLGTATASRHLARQTGYENPEEAYIGGLLHDIGKMTMIRNRPETYAEVLADVYGGMGSAYEVEIEAFGYSHAQVGALLARKWNFPSRLGRGILYHHAPEAAPEDRLLASIVNLADAIMIFKEIDFVQNPKLDLVELPSSKYLGVGKSALEVTIVEVTRQIEELPGSIKG